MEGCVHSVQTLGTLDGPGVRFVLFLQGCPLRCACCHNPDTWRFGAGERHTPEEIFARVLRCRPYFGADGGLTISGGEVLSQPEFATELFRLCRAAHIHTCLDTSGCVLNDSVRELLTLTDLVLLDVKYTTEDGYASYVGGGCTLQKVRDFLAELEARRIPAWLRQVVIPGKNDDVQNLAALADIANAYTCVQKVELLAFRKLCHTKYEALGIPFPFAEVPEPDKAQMETLRKALAKLCPGRA